MIREIAAEGGSPLRWFKSSYSDSGDSNECVEAATTPRVVHIRDSKKAEGPQLMLAPGAWTEFLTHVSES